MLDQLGTEKIRIGNAQEESGTFVWLSILRVALRLSESGSDMRAALASSALAELLEEPPRRGFFSSELPRRLL